MTKFPVITVSDWGRSIAAARAEPNEVREKIEREVEALCKWCRGSGSTAVEIESSQRYACEDCGGSGRVKEAA